jgi:hypothetical protein
VCIEPPFPFGALDHSAQRQAFVSEAKIICDARIFAEYMIEASHSAALSVGFGI